MKFIFSTAFTVCLMTLTGCGNGTPGGPGANVNKPPVVGRADETFTLDVPNLSTSLKQGETKMFSIAIKRGKNTDQDVKLSFTDMPKGVTFDPASPTIKHGDQDVKISATAADDAALGDFVVKVAGHPTTGADATNTMKLTVVKK